MKKLLLSLLFFIPPYVGTVYPYTFVVIGKSDTQNWEARSRDFIKNIRLTMQKKYRMAEIDKREIIETFPNIKKESDIIEFYNTYNFNTIAHELVIKIIESIYTHHEPVNLYCFGTGSIVLSIALLYIAKNHNEIASYLPDNISGSNLPYINNAFDTPRSDDSINTQFSSDDLSTPEEARGEDLSPIPDHVTEKLSQEQYDNLVKIINDIKIIQQKDNANPNLKLAVKATVAVCGVVTLIITTVVAPIITIIVAL